jgi:predicted glycogen debranching enzyme
MQIAFEQATARDLDGGLAREWLITNGLGGYASGTVPGINTRRYHGLLIAAVHPPVDRVALLVRLHADLTVDDEQYELASAEYADGTIYPKGYQYLDSFALDDGLPTWHHALGPALLRTRIWMVPGHNITAIRYRLVAGSGPVEIALRPLTAARDHHAVQHGHAGWRFAVESVTDGLRVQATPAAPPLWLLARGASVVTGGDWYWRYLLREERARGYDHVEDLYQPGTFRAILLPGDQITLIASAEDPALGLPDADMALAEARAAHTRHVASGALSAEAAGSLHTLSTAFRAAAAAFVVRRDADRANTTHGVSVIAGYHWSTDWGRDAMISLPGILLVGGRVAEAGALLRAFASYVDQGMIPNRFPYAGEAAEYNTADTSLWLFQALRHTLAAEPDAAARARLLADLYPRLREIVVWHRRGTRHGIGVDPSDDLLRAGEAGTADVVATQLTWMDARSGNSVVTPRVGKPVEINALWIAALELMATWAPEQGDDPAPYLAAADRARASFVRRFWYEEGGYLYDVVDDPDGDDASLRPNQLIALAADLMPRDLARSALERIAERLLTPYGLRTLSPDDARYRGRCVGDQPTRDAAYHQGTVWPWLLGPYVDAYQRIYEQTAPRDLVLPFVAHLQEVGLGSVSEIFDGDPPHAPRGCIAKAWSVAELLRVALMLSST